MSSPYARPRLTDRRTAAAAPSGVAAQAGPTLGEALADTDIALVRIRCRYDAGGRARHHLTAYTATFRRIWFDPADHDTDLATRTELIDMVFGAWPHIDWNRDHQIELATGTVTTAPEAWENGFLPEDDLAFGGRPVVHVTAGLSRTDAAPAPARALAGIGPVGP